MVATADVVGVGRVVLNPSASMVFVVAVTDDNKVVLSNVDVVDMVGI